jgi:tetratricopeptide (TPR) repeat protein
MRPPGSLSENAGRFPRAVGGIGLRLLFLVPPIRSVIQVFPKTRVRGSESIRNSRRIAMKLISPSLSTFVICCALAGSAFAADTQHTSCLDPNSPTKTISRCTETINRGDKEPPSSRASAYKNRGDAYLFNGKVDDAIADFTAAIRISPNADLYTNRGAAYYQKGDMDHAKADWAEAKRLRDPGKSRQ